MKHFQALTRSFQHVSRNAALALSLLLVVASSAQSSTALPTRGKRFWTGFLQNGFGAQSLKVHIVTSVATSGTVSIPLTGWSAPFNAAANDVTVINVPTSAESSGSGVIQDRGVLIQSVDSINVFTSSYQNYTHDLSQVLPEASLGNSYRVDSYHGLPNFNNLHKSELLVVATQPGTQVRITPAVNTVNGNTAGVPFVVDLEEGQCYQLQAATDLLDLTGTLIEATTVSGPCRPFVVLGGSACASAPGSCQACDAIFEQLMPTNAWGTQYYTAPIQGVNTSTYRVLAHVNNTSVSTNGNAPVILNAGQTILVNGTTAPVHIQASQPVSVAQLLEGYSCAGNGDPSLFLVLPAGRMSRSATFQTVSSPQITTHSISLVVPTAAVGQVTLDGTVVNPSLFQAYPSISDRRHAKIPVTAGVHRLQSNLGFQAYQFGLGYGESYAASVNDIRAIPIQEDSVVCGGGPVTLNAPFPINNATWTRVGAPGVVLANGNSYSFTPNSSGSYVVSGTLPVSGCPRSFTYHVGIPLTIPTLMTANDQPTIDACQYEPVQLGLSPPPDPAWFSIQWTPAGSLSNDTIADPIATPMTSTWYRVRITSPSGCGDMDDSIRVNITPGSIIDLSTTAQTGAVCQGAPIQLGSNALRVIARDDLNTTPGAMWTAVQGGTISAVCGSQSGNALYFNGNGQRYAQTTAMNMTGGGELRFRLKIANGMAPCDNADPGENVVLEYSVNNGLAWTILNTYDQDSYPGFEPIEVSVPAAAQTASTMFRLRQLAHNGTGQDNWALDDVIIARVDNAFLGYSWSPAGTLNNASIPAPVATPSTSGWYVLNATDPGASCVYRDSVQVQVNPTFALNMTPDTTLCAAAGIPISAVPTITSPVSFAWTPNNGTLSATNVQSPTATPTSTTTYNVTATAAGCIATGQVTITVGQLLDLIITAATDTICQGQSTQLNAVAGGGNGLTYAWTGAGLSASNIPDPVASPTQTTTYSCTVTHTTSGCSLTRTQIIVVTTGYNANAGPDLTLCSTLGHQLGVQHNVLNPTYSWSPSAGLNASNIQAPTLLNEGTTTYTVTITDPNGCSTSDEVTITRAFAGIAAQLSASACANTPPTLNAPTTAASYSWSTGQSTPSIVPSVSGPHTVTMTNAQGCQFSTTFNVTLFPIPVLDLGPDVALCGASSHVVNAGNAGSSFTWNTGATGQQLTVTTSGNYSVTVVDANGCNASDNIHVQLDPLPLDALTDVSSCASLPIQLNAGNPGSTYLWSTGYTAQTITPDSSGTYSVTVTTDQNCAATFDAVVIIFPEVSVNLGNDTTICAGTSLLLDAGNEGLSFAWNNGATGSTIEVDNAGTYSVTVSNSGCSATDAITISALDAPIDALQDATECIGTPVTLDAGNANCTYLWNTGSVGRTLTVNSSGTFSVVVRNSIGCSTSMDAVINFIPPPSVSLGPDTVLCEGETLTLDAGNPGSTYSWNTGSTTRTIPVAEAGTYSTEVNNGFCQRADEITVLFNPSPVRMATRQFHTCLGEDEQYVRLDAGNQGSRYSWSTGETAQIILAGAYGWYVVEVNNQYDCAARDSAQVIEYCPSAIFIPNTFTPNGDGTNDIFIPVGKNIATMHLYVFDRWGNQLYETDDPNMGWDGTYAGEIVKNDVYVWRLNYRFQEDKDGTIGQEQQQMGHIQVLR